MPTHVYALSHHIQNNQAVENITDIRDGCPKSRRKLDQIVDKVTDELDEREE